MRSDQKDVIVEVLQSLVDSDWNVDTDTSEVHELLTWERNTDITFGVGSDATVGVASNIADVDGFEVLQSLVDSDWNWNSDQVHQVQVLLLGSGVSERAAGA